MRSVALCLAGIAAGCGSPTNPVSVLDSGVPSDGAPPAEAGASDGATVDLATPPDLSAAVDSATPPDLAISPDLAIPPDLAPARDLTPPPDLASLVQPGKARFLSGPDGLGGPVIDASPDEAGNIWAVSPDALFVLRAGAAKFRRYTDADGLHVWSVITAVAGGGPNQGFVGLEGYESDFPDMDTMDEKLLGNAEKVTLNQDGTITTLHYDNIHADVSANYWETRSACRLLYVHDGPNAGHLFMGSNHGITHIFHDGWGDHIHPEVVWEPDNALRIGLYYGLAIDPVTNGLWACGRDGCGLQSFNADPRAWVSGKFIYAFTVFSGDHSLQVPHGFEENFVGAAVTPDDTVWMLSKTYGLASWNPKEDGAFSYGKIQQVPVPGLGFPIDVAADTDNTIFVADSNQVLKYDPQSGTATPLPVPSGDVRRLYVDAQSVPRALYVSTGGGLWIYRGQ